MSARRAGRRPAVHILTLGCPKNEVDSDRIAASLSPSFDVVGDPDVAQVVVVNTCAFIEEAVSESIECALGFADWKARRDGRVLVLSGCLPSRYGDELERLLPEVDACVPVADEASIAGIVSRATGVRARAPASRALRTRPGASAYLQVSDGCHRACSFCTIPAIRGPYVSRPADELADEARALVAGGAKELVLVGQDVSAWGRDLATDETLAGLVRRLAGIDGLAWLRLMYVQPDGVTPELLEAISEEPKVCRYLDMPLQHAAATVLHSMGRRGSAAEYARLVGAVRSLVPGVFLRTTLIAGFPGESRADATTLQGFVRDVAFDYTGVFAFSPEEGTPAAVLPDQVPARTRLARAQRLRDVADEVGFEHAARLVGQRLEVLVEGVEDGVCVGRHRGQAPDVDGVVLLDRDMDPGRLALVEITESLGYDLVGEVR